MFGPCLEKEESRLGAGLGTGLKHAGYRLGEGWELHGSRLREDRSKRVEGGIHWTPNVTSP